MQMQFVRSFVLILFAGLAACTPSIAASSAAPNAAQDRIDVLGHYPLTNVPVKRLVPTRHYSRYYLYAEKEDGTTVTVIDVTNAEAPSLVANISYPTRERSDDLVAITGTAALVAGPATTPTRNSSQVVRIMSFADPAHPQAVREFQGVTAISRDPQRGLIFLANREGVWILWQRPAEDPAVRAAYNHYVLYDH
jgi:hypothetical protein